MHHPPPPRYICGAASGRAKCYFAQVGGGLTLRAMQMRRVDETIQVHANLAASLHTLTSESSID